MSLQVWLPLNGDLHNQGLNNIIMTNNGATIDNNGKIGKCYSFNGTSNVIYNRNISINCNKLSMCCWIYRTTSHTGDGYISSLNNGAGYADAAIALDSPTSTSVCFVGGGNYSLTATISPNTWNHIAVTYDGTKVIGYLNGQKVGEVTNTQILTRTQLAIGCRCNSTNSFIYYFPGKLNDFRLYDHCLSMKEVKEISKGLVLHYKLDSIINNKIYDCSGYQNNGTIVGNLTLSSNTSKYDNSTYFSGNGNLIKLTPFYFDTENWTVSLWYYHTLAISSTWNSFICLSKDNGADANKKFALMFNNGYANNLWCKANSGSARVIPIKVNTWTHLVLTSEGKVYEDGVLKSSAINPGANMTGTYDLVIGSRSASAGIGTTTTQYTGNISDVRIYSTILTEEQIKELYNTSATIDNKGNIYTRELVEE